MTSPHADTARLLPSAAGRPLSLAPCSAARVPAWLPLAAWSRLLARPVWAVAGLLAGLWPLLDAASPAGGVFPGGRVCLLRALLTMLGLALLFRSFDHSLLDW